MRMTGDANDFVNFKSNAREKTLLVGYIQYHTRSLDGLLFPPKYLAQQFSLCATLTPRPLLTVER